MRYLVVIVVLFVLAAEATPQEDVLFKGDVQRGGFGGPVLKYTSIKDQGALMVGGRGGWIINHRLVLGGGGYGVFTEVDAPHGVMPELEPIDLDIEFGYGGFEIEYIFHPNRLTHFSLYTLIGGGGSNFVRDVGPVTESNEQIGESDVMFVLEPAVNGELNVTKWFRLNAGLSYRFVTGVDQLGLDDGDFRGAAGTLGLKFGTF